MSSIKKEDWLKYVEGASFAPMFRLSENDAFLPLDFTAANTALTPELIGNTALFSTYISNLLQQGNHRFGIGGYNEHRTVYSRSEVFGGEEPRRLHLGIDVWGEARTPVYLPLNGTIHSFAFNNHYGDYGATLIVKHATPLGDFHTLYGHISLKDIEHATEGAALQKGSLIAHFGVPEENGHWPPHLHFQIILNMQGWKGDYPGVCAFSQREDFLENCPDGWRFLGLP